MTTNSFFFNQQKKEYRIRMFIFKMTGWILFFIIITSFLAGAIYFYFAGWLTVNTFLEIPDIDSPVNMVLWRKILAEINQRQSSLAPEFQNIF